MVARRHLPVSEGLALGLVFVWHSWRWLSAPGAFALPLPTRCSSQSPACSLRRTTTKCHYPMPPNFTTKCHHPMPPIFAAHAGSFDDLLQTTPLARSRRSGGLLSNGAVGSFEDVLAAGLETPLSDLQPYTVRPLAMEPSLAAMEEEPVAADEAAAPGGTAGTAGAAAAAAGQAASAAAGGEPGSALAAPFAARLRVASGSESGGSGLSGGGAEGGEEPRTSPFVAAADAEMAEAGASQQRGQGQQGLAALQRQAQQTQLQQPRRGSRQYWEEADPSKALGMLEDELQQITCEWLQQITWNACLGILRVSACGGMAACERQAARVASCCKAPQLPHPHHTAAASAPARPAPAGNYSTDSPESEGCQMMRRMLEAECEAIRSAQQSVAAAAAAAGCGGGGGEAVGGTGKKRARVPHPGGGDSGILSGLLKQRAGLQVGQLWACVGRAQVVYSVQWPPQLVLGSTLFWACMAALAVVTERPALFMHN